MDFSVDHFSLFGLPRSFRLDSSQLDKRYREIQSQVHPDKFSDAGDTERLLSLQRATRVNEAYQTLRKPLSRVMYLLSLLGHDVNVSDNTAMPSEFLVEQMEWREAVSEARIAREQGELEQLHYRVKQRMNECYELVATSLDDQHDFPLASDCVRRLMFLEKLLFEIDEAISFIEE